MGEYPNLAFGGMNSLVRDNPGDDSLRYTAAVKVADNAPVPEGMERIEIPASTYAVFLHKGHVSEFENTLEFIWKTWAAQNGARLANALLSTGARPAERTNPREAEIDLWKTGGRGLRAYPSRA